MVEEMHTQRHTGLPVPLETSKQRRKGGCVSIACGVAACLSLAVTAAAAAADAVAATSVKTVVS